MTVHIFLIYLHFHTESKAYLFRVGAKVGRNCVLYQLAHLKWLKKLEITNVLYRETLDEYMASYEEQEAKIERYETDRGNH